MITRRAAMKLGAIGVIAPSLGWKLSSAPPVAARESAESVPLFSGNAARTSETPGPLPTVDSPIVVKWRLATDGSENTSPVVVGHTVFLGSRDNHLYAIDSETALIRWKFETGGAIVSTPAVEKSTVFVGSRDNNLYAIDAESGRERWKLETGDSISASPAISDETVFAGSNDGTLYAVDFLSGKEIWRFETADRITSSPSAINGTVFIDNRSNILYALDISSGEEIWRFESDGALIHPHIATDSTVVLVSRVSGVDLAELVAIDVDSGFERWRFTPTGWIMDAGVRENTIFAACSDDPLRTLADNPNVADDLRWQIYAGDYICAIDVKSGQERWRTLTGRTGKLAIVQNSLFGTSIRAAESEFESSMFTISAESGTEIWRIPTIIDFDLHVRPTIVDHAIYINSAENELCALGNLPTSRLTKRAILRGAPSHRGVERAAFDSDTEIERIHTQEVRDGETWVKVTVDGMDGWIPLDTIAPSPLPSGGEVEYIYIPE